ncbi:uncharacterized protein LOC121786270 isoform X2 [Salvia splendens]|nr:uncharacterized protein LOC121786270 isoform X2 [Salvia splendens]
MEAKLQNRERILSVNPIEQNSRGCPERLVALDIGAFMEHREAVATPDAETIFEGEMLKLMRVWIALPLEMDVAEELTEQQQCARLLNITLILCLLTTCLWQHYPLLEHACWFE